jgi:flagellin
MIQTATGAMNQVEQVLQTMSTLATEASNAGNTFSDNANLQLEMNALAQQINSTTNQTQYNGLTLLTGQYGTAGTSLTLQIGANQGQTLSFNIGSTDAESLGVGSGQTGGIAAGNMATQYNKGVIQANGTGATTAAAGLASGITATNSLLQGGMNLQLVMTATYTGGGFALSGGTAQLETQNGQTIGTAVTLTAAQINGGTITLGDTATGATLSVTLAANAFSAVGTADGTASQTDQFTLDTPAAKSTEPKSSNGWQASSNINGINILTQSGAQAAITNIQSAINTLSSSQAQLGAVQDRLNYTVSNLSNSSQNLQDAHSTITNTDMASAYTQFSQQQVLEQVGISMLSQAQQQPQMILKLMQ